MHRFHLALSPLLPLAVLCGLCGPVLAQDSKDAGLPASWAGQLEWRQIGPANMSGRIVDFAIYEKDPTQYWIATASGGLLKTTDNGIKFEHQFDREDVVSLGAVDVAQSDPNIVWVGTGENHPRNSVSYGNGVYKSVDGGKTWEHMGLEKTFQTGDLVIHPTNPDVVYVGAAGRLYGPNEERGLYKTTDGGKTWNKILYIDDKTGINDICMHPEDPDTMIVSTYERQRDGFDTNDPVKKIAPGSGIWRTENGGESWEKLTRGLPTGKLGRCSFDYWLANPQVVFALVESEKIGMAGELVGWPGVTTSDAEAGAKVTAIAKGGPGEKAELEAGDIITRVSGNAVASKRHFDEHVAQHEIGEKIEIEFVRDGENKTATLELEKRKAPTARNTGRRGRGGNSNRPFGTRLGGQVPNVQKLQGKDGHEHGGLYRSNDGGTSWTRINSINPRPMYFSQVRVDPKDDNYLYVLGVSMARSKDGGETFTNDAGRGVHADQHALWINPSDSRHLILGTDGGTYVSHDRSDTWDHLNHVAIGQFYHVTAGPRRDYWVYGGLQDNGTWGAPHRSGMGRGPINEDWIRIGGGDGFVCRVDANDPLLVYSESQNGATGRRHLGTLESARIRPLGPRPTAESEKAAAEAKAAAEERRAEQSPTAGSRGRQGRQGRRARGGQASAQSARPSYRYNWKTPFILSHHNSKIYYSAGNHVFRSLDRGNDHRPISPDITRTKRGSGTALAESAKNPDVLYVGTDDGALFGTRDGGKTWQDLWVIPSRDVTEDEDSVKVDAPSAPGAMPLPSGPRSLHELVPGPRWVTSLEASRHEASRVYLCLDGHRSDDDDPYVFVSEDYGASWSSIRANLPWGSTRVLREDHKNPDLLYCGTETGIWASIDRGQSWTRIHGKNFPTVAVHEVAQHDASGDIILATHGRSLWVLDATPLRSMTKEAVLADATLFEPNDVVRWTSSVSRGSSGGARRYVGQNPSNAAEIFYALGKPARSISLTLHTSGGELVRTLDTKNEKGLHRVTWDMRREMRAADRASAEQRLKDRFGSEWRNYLRFIRNRAPAAEPGNYTVKLVVDGKSMTADFEVQRDPNRTQAQLTNLREAEYQQELDELEKKMRRGELR